jgi:transposase
MFLKRIEKKNKSDKIYTSFRLCESIRIGGSVRHNVLLNLGGLEGLDVNERKDLANYIECLYLGTTPMFEVTSEVVKAYATEFYSQLRDKNKQVKVDANKSAKVTNTDIETVDLNSIQHDDVREIGAEWLCYQAIQELGLVQMLRDKQWDEQTINRALTLIISKAVYPASEHKTAQWIESSSAISTLIFKQQTNLTHHQLYKVGDLLYAQKDALCEHLSTKTNELFNLTDKIVFFDLTNTYFEGRKVDSELAQFGRSKEKRSDAKLVSLALVVNAEGFVKYSKIYEGNIYEAHTLEKTIDELSANTNAIKPVIVMDAAFGIEENLKMLTQKGYDYLCIARVKLKEFTIVNEGQKPVVITDNRKNKIELQRVIKPDCTDQFMYIRSDQKAVKEASMEVHYSTRFEQELTALSFSILTKKGTKILTAVHERIGKIKERYPKANKNYTIKVEHKDNIATKITFAKTVVPPPNKDHGVYFIQTSLKETDEKVIWNIYNTLTEVEATFRTLKTDLHLRPVYHQKDSRTEAHIHLGVLAYMIVNTIRFKLKQKGLNHDWSNIIRIMNTQKVVTTSLKNEKGNIIIIEKCSEPKKQVLEIYLAANYKPKPFTIKKHVVPLT